MTVLGLMAGTLTTGCWLPRLPRSWRTRSTADISWTYLAVGVHRHHPVDRFGFASRDITIIIINLATVAAPAVLAGLKTIFGRDDPMAP